MEHAKHIWRAVLILLFGLVAFVVVTHFLVPKTFGEYGHYRGDSLQEQADVPPVIHGGRDSCKVCHKEQYDTVMGGAHKAVNCETCHMPLATHVKDGAKFDRMATFRVEKHEPDKEPDIVNLCATCHQKLAGRPDAGDYKFPQVDVNNHYGQRKRCFMCHESAHAPTVQKD